MLLASAHLSEGKVCEGRLIPLWFMKTVLRRRPCAVTLGWKEVFPPTPHMLTWRNSVDYRTLLFLVAPKCTDFLCALPSSPQDLRNFAIYVGCQKFYSVVYDPPKKEIF